MTNKMGIGTLTSLVLKYRPYDGVKGTLRVQPRKRLEALNLEIAKAEDEGDWKALSAILAAQTSRGNGGRQVPLLAFRRASGACIDAGSCLDAVARSGPRQTEILSIIFEGQCIAIVRCHVDVNGRTYLNIRLFVREDAQSTDWRLLGWANDEVGKATKTAT